jgi:hypothetical protein
VEIGHERLDVFMTTVRLVQRVLEQHVRRGDLIDGQPSLSAAAQRSDSRFAATCAASQYKKREEGTT